jgi:hypothetical protein
MNLRRASVIAATLAVGASALAAQEGPGLRQARALLASLDYDSAVAVAQRALEAPGLARADLPSLYELLGFAYGAMDSTRGAVEAFKALISVAPDREPDQRRVSPKIYTLYQVALGQSLVAQRVRLDSATFVESEGAAAIHFQLSRAALVRTSIVGAVSVVVDSQSGVGAVSARWDGMSATHEPAPPGRYRLVVRVVAGRDTIERSESLVVSHAPLDTVAHLTALPGYTPQAETEQPQRNWSSLSNAASYLSIGIAAVLALHNASLGTGLPGGVLVVGAASLGSGLVFSLRKPPPRPVPSAVLYNRLLGELLARQNEVIAADNVARRRKVVLTVVQLREGGP